MCCKPLRPLLAHVSLTRIDIPVRSSVGSEHACGRRRPASGSCCGQECPRAGGSVRRRPHLPRFRLWTLDCLPAVLGLRAMIVELINTGSELMLGRVLNTHQQWLCRQLADLGYVVTRQVAVPDTGSDIERAVREALARADLVIATGGLGPTSDDLTRDLV